MVLLVAGREPSGLSRKRQHQHRTVRAVPLGIRDSTGRLPCIPKLRYHLGMADSDANRDSLDPHQVLAESAALARHLEASGIAFLPAANEQQVAELAAVFDVTQDLPAASETQASPTRVAEENPVGSSARAAKPPATPPPSTRPPAPKPAAPIVVEDVQQPYPGDALNEPDRVSQLQVLSEEVAACTRCEKLAACRTNTVFGEGHPSARIVFFGEGPGADEDRTGRPFVGKAGQLLTKMIEACSFSRDDVYILNSVKCRPPGNRNPDPSELGNCSEYYEKQLQILRPEYIVCLGAVSSQALLNSKLSVGRLRGKFHRYFDSKVLVTYHPAYLLRTPAAKKAAWQDLQLMLRDAGIDPTARK